MKSHLSYLKYSCLILLISIFCSGYGFAQIDDWVVFQDTATETECGVVNASNAELLVVYDMGNMAVVSGPDTIIDDLYVDELNQVFYQDNPAGFIEIAEDGDGLPTVFWTTLTGTVIKIDTLTGEPSDSGYEPYEIFNTGCDGCDYIDASDLCEDGSNSSGDDTTNDFNLNLCGAGAMESAAAAVVLLPFLSLASRRKY